MVELSMKLILLIKIAFKKTENTYISWLVSGDNRSMDCVYDTVCVGLYIGFDHVGLCI